jgi:signal transduction histidine kinase/CheY-like chemotaxis protein
MAVGAPVIMAVLVGSGERANWYGPGHDEALLATAGILIAAALVWQQSRRIDRDLARQKDLEDRVRHAEKMESVGVLAAGVAHDFNNLLVGIISFAELLRRDLEADDARQKVIDEIVTAADSAASLTQQLLAFSRKQMLAPQIISLNQIVANNEMLIRSVAGPDLRVDLALAEALPPSRVDPQQMQRALLNLVMNARDATAGGGRLLIETAVHTVGERLRPEHPQLPTGTYVMLAVDDTGSGVSAEDQARIFEPFYSTKGVGKGTGLGLSTVYGIVTQSEGHVFLTPKPSPGARFEIYLPVAATGEGVRPLAEPVAGSLPALATILVVEDNEIVQRAIGETLSVVGYQLLVAGSGEEALKMSAEHAGPIDLLLADVVLPGDSGTTVARQVRRQRPELKVLFMSGYNEDETLRAQLWEGRVAFLKKPFRPAELMAAVRQALSAAVSAESKS